MNVGHSIPVVKYLSNRKHCFVIF